MIKVCYIIGQLAIGGAEKQLYELVKGIDKKIFLPIVISLSQNGFWSIEIQKLGIEVIELERRKNKEIKRLLHLIKLLWQIKPDIVHTYLFSANSYGRVAAILNKSPVIISSERNLPEIGKDKTTYQVYIDKVLSFFSDAIICNSKIAADVLVKVHKYDKKKIFIVHNGISIVSSNISYKEKHEFIIGTVCRLSPQKNLKMFLNMAKSLTYYKNNLKFMIVGDGPMKQELVDYSIKLGIGDKVNFCGEQKNIHTFLEKMNLFVLTSLYEGLSNSIMEAMLYGIPVVATDVGGNRELISDGETGFLCPPDDIDDLVKKVMYIIDNPQEAQRIGENGRNKIINEFSSNMMVKKTESIYLRLLDKNSKTTK